MKKQFYTATFLILTCLLIFILPLNAQQSGCDADRYFNTVFEEVTVTPAIKYGENTTLSGISLDLLMDIYEPTGDQLEERPLIILAHGGGFTGGNRADMDFICEDFAERGFVVASISYRLIDVPITDPSILPTGVVMAVSDMKAAVRYFREDAVTDNLYRIDPDYIFAGGGSAGAVMANNLAYLDSLDNIDPSFMALLNSQGGFAGNSSTNTQYSYEVQGVLNYAGSVFSNDWIDANDPPLYSFHNEFDDIVTCGYSAFSAFGSCDMHAMAEAVGIKNQFHFYSESDGHVLWPYTYVRHESAQFLGEIMCDEKPETPWEEVSSGLESPGHMVFDISAVDENVVWAVATAPRFDVATQSFSRSIDGGQTWTSGTIPVSDPDLGIDGIFALDENTAWAISLAFPDQTSGKVHKTTDGGATWIEQTSAFTEPGEGPHGIHFFDENDGFALSYIETASSSTDSHSGYITSDGGDTWTRLTSDVYPAVPGERFSAINLDLMEARGNHIWFGLSNGKVFHSSDRGHTWEVQTAAPPTRAITSIAFKDEMNGIAITSRDQLTNTVVNKAYATSDGGTTWSEIPVPTSPRIGGIQFVEGSADSPGACGTYMVYYSYSSGGGPGAAYTTDDGQTWNFTSEQPFYSMEFVSPEVGWGGGITHGPESGLFKWTGDALNGNENCFTSTREKITDNSDLLIYPSPTTDLLNIKLENNWRGEIALRIVNTLGQELYTSTFSKNINEWNGQINLSEMPSGIYQVIISDGENMMVKPVLKN